MNPRGGREPRAILVTRLRFLGDVILTTPVLAALARAFPGAAVDYLCERPFDEILAGHPRLRRVVAFDREREGMGALLGRIRGHYDAILDLFGNPRSAWLTGISGAALRVGQGRFPRSLLYNRRPAPGAARESAVRHHLRFAEVLCGPQPHADPFVAVSAAQRAEGRRLLEDRGLGGNAVAILTGASQANKEWPVAAFVRLAAQISMAGRQRPVFLGQPGKRDRLARVRELSHSQVVILPELGLSALAGLLANCRALVTADGGVMHLAVALGVPTLALFGPSDPAIWFPYEHLPHAELLCVKADCRPCHRHECPDPFCMEAIDPELAFARLQALLERT
ncbi:MAG: glycosyltransferase family 9 protein [Candidatus Krumholzibacteriota bacterium]|nr:glycosyltransferase family 9 protein [Candidatus Krumholzibacteriota bacterium]